MSNVAPILPLCRLYSAVLKSSTTGTTGVPSAVVGQACCSSSSQGFCFSSGRLGRRSRPGKSAALDQRLRHAQHRAAASAGKDSGNWRHRPLARATARSCTVRAASSAVGRKAQIGARRRRVEVLIDRLIALGHQVESAAAAVPAPRPRWPDRAETRSAPRSKSWPPRSGRSSACCGSDCGRRCARPTARSGMFAPPPSRATVVPLRKRLQISVKPAASTSRAGADERAGLRFVRPATAPRRPEPTATTNRPPPPAGCGAVARGSRAQRSSPSDRPAAARTLRPAQPPQRPERSSAATRSRRLAKPISRLARRDVQFEKRRADRAQPPGAQAGEHQPGIADAGRHAQQRARRRDTANPSTGQRARRLADCPGRRPAGCRFLRPAARLPSRNNSATSISAETMMNKLKPRNSPSNGVVPAAAASPSRLTGMNSKPERRGIELAIGRPALRPSRPAAGRSGSRWCRQTGSTTAGGRRPARRTPWAWCDSRPSTFRPACGRGRESNGNGASQSPIESRSVTPGICGVRSGSAARPVHGHDRLQAKLGLRLAHLGRACSRARSR